MKLAMLVFGWITAVISGALIFPALISSSNTWLVAIGVLGLVALTAGAISFTYSKLNAALTSENE